MSPSRNVGFARFPVTVNPVYQAPSRSGKLPEVKSQEGFSPLGSGSETRMESGLAAYVVSYYGHFMNKQEQLAQRHLMATVKATHGLSDHSAQQEARGSKTLSALLSDDPVVLELTRDGGEAFIERVAGRILAEHGDEIFLNHCPRCGALAKTPKARQCRFCRHDWHGSNPST